MNTANRCSPTRPLRRRSSGEQRTQRQDQGSVPSRAAPSRGWGWTAACSKCLPPLRSDRHLIMRKSRPLPRCGRHQTRSCSPPQFHPTDADAITDNEVVDHVRLRDEFCGNLWRYKHRLAADASHAKKAARLAAAGRCAEPGCTKPQACGVKGCNRPEFCRNNKKEGMVNLCSVTRCRQNGCARKPAFGVPGTKIVEFCHYCTTSRREW